MNKVVGCNPCSVDLESPQSQALSFLHSCSAAWICFSIGLIYFNWLKTKPFGFFWSNYSDLTPNGDLVREIPLFQGNLGWWNIIIWPDSWPFINQHLECIFPSFNEDQVLDVPPPPPAAVQPAIVTTTGRETFGWDGSFFGSTKTFCGKIRNGWNFLRNLVNLLG